MRKNLSTCLICFMSIFFVPSAIFGQNGIPFPADKKIPVVKIYHSGKIEKYKVEAQNRRKSGELPKSKFEVHYTGFSIGAQTAFAEAVNLWSYLISSEVPIIIEANWEPLSEGVLGAAGAAQYYRVFKNAPTDSVWYPIALANKIAGFDVDPEIPDIEARFNSDFDWYLGTDGNCPDNRHDLITVVMHEIGHGLGFAGSANVDTKTGLGSWGSGTPFPIIYDVFVFSSKGLQLINKKAFPNPSAKLKTEYTSGNIFFEGDLSNAAADIIPLFAPETWNPGSSYSHLGEKFNSTPNAMMTYSVGSGEVTHHPGPVTLGMLADMGWVNLLFVHEPIKDMEAMTEPLLIQTKIISDSTVIDSTVRLHYSANNFVTDSVVIMQTFNDTLFSAYIPVLATDTIKYYFEATTVLNRTHYLPSQGVSPVITIKKTLAFAVGADQEAPVIVHKETKNIFNFDKTLTLNFGANDNIGLDTVYIQYKLNNGEWVGLPCENKGYSELDDLYFFEASLSVENYEDGDTLYYTIVATDLAQNSNTTVLPETGYYKVAILDYGTPAIVKNINFDEADDEYQIINNGLSVFQPEGFSSKCLNSPHPYLEGEPFPTDEIEYSAMFKFPVTLKESEAYLRFDEIVIVEPGETGSIYGQQNFYDYVVVEGSVDSAKTWFNFEDGYDCRISTMFNNAYNKQWDGTESMFTSHTINLLANENLVGNNNVLIRFRLYSDQLSAGWGLAIDNIEIQPEIISANEQTFHNSDLRVYPNPSKGIFNISVSSDKFIDNYTLSVYNAIGKRVFSDKGTGSSKILNNNINISALPAGMYFVKFDSGNKTLSQKIVIE